MIDLVAPQQKGEGPWLQRKWNEMKEWIQDWRLLKQ